MFRVVLPGDFAVLDRGLPAPGVLGVAPDDQFTREITCWVGSSLVRVAAHIGADLAENNKIWCFIGNIVRGGPTKVLQYSSSICLMKISPKFEVPPVLIIEFSSR